MDAALSQRRYLTYGGNETYLLFVQGFPLREFCAFEVFEDEAAWTRLVSGLLAPIAKAAADSKMGLMTDCLVWRASADYARRLGTADVATLNERAVRRTRDFLAGWRDGSASAKACPVIVSADHGPRGDGYAVTGRVAADAAYDYHAPQVEALAAAGVDLLVPLTMTSLQETLGILRAAQRHGLPALVSPTIEPDGKLPDGTPLGDFVRAVDEATAGYPVAFMVNCVHPTHLEPILRGGRERGEAWVSRIRGLRANASAKTHAELDNSTELDRGDPVALAAGVQSLQRTYDLSVVGGCCGTDAEHLQRIAAATA